MATAEGGYYKEGNLFKRQRGLSGHLYRSSLIFQQRFCRLTAESLDYYESHKKLKVILHNTATGNTMIKCFVYYARIQMEGFP